MCELRSNVDMMKRVVLSLGSSKYIIFVYSNVLEYFVSMKRIVARGYILNI